MKAIGRSDIGSAFHITMDLLLQILLFNSKNRQQNIPPSTRSRSHYHHNKRSKLIQQPFIQPAFRIRSIFSKERLYSISCISSCSKSICSQQYTPPTTKSTQLSAAIIQHQHMEEPSTADTRSLVILHPVRLLPTN
ncbi:hypothetical protein Nepgr_008030 [Nepenthes gracilis]|uniref:Uncharacterized protein n=1 Tax=Nepenthes gracilis TaxID=150966 RepID=A0AAD3S866_NEPGR|nr:hypothetical protein Nepgr_008030 [Nepenthes gracilis]